MFKTKFRGVEYRVRVGRMKGNTVGRCTRPSIKKPTIKFDPLAFTRPKLSRDLLEFLIHEALHACFWDMDEAAINESGRNITSFLKKVGIKCNAKKVLARLKQK